MSPPEQCPKCGASVDTHVGALIPILILPDPPRQTEPNVRVTRWQCMAVMAHSGIVREPAP